MRRLRCTDGATMIMALFAFLIAAMVSMTMVSAAMTAMRAAKRQQTYEQAYLVVQSTAEIVNGMVTDADIKVEGEDGEYTKPANSNHDKPIEQAIKDAISEKIEHPEKKESSKYTANVTFASGSDDEAEAALEMIKIDGVKVRATVQIPELYYNINNNWDFDMMIEVVDPDENDPDKDKSYASEVLHYSSTRDPGTGVITWAKPTIKRR